MFWRVCVFPPRRAVYDTTTVQAHCSFMLRLAIAIEFRALQRLSNKALRALLVLHSKAVMSSCLPPWCIIAILIITAAPPVLLKVWYELRERSRRFLQISVNTGSCLTPVRIQKISWEWLLSQEPVSKCVFFPLAVFIFYTNPMKFIVDSA